MKDIAIGYAAIFGISLLYVTPWWVWKIVLLTTTVGVVGFLVVAAVIDSVLYLLRLAGRSWRGE